MFKSLKTILVISPILSFLIINACKTTENRDLGLVKINEIPSEFKINDSEVHSNIEKQVKGSEMNSDSYSTTDNNYQRYYNMLNNQYSNVYSDSYNDSKINNFENSQYIGNNNNYNKGVTSGY